MWVKNCQKKCCINCFWAVLFVESLGPCLTPSVIDRRSLITICDLPEKMRRNPKPLTIPHHLWWCDVLLILSGDPFDPPKSLSSSPPLPLWSISPLILATLHLFRWCWWFSLPAHQLVRRENPHHFNHITCKGGSLHPYINCIAFPVCICDQSEEGGRAKSSHNCHWHFLPSFQTQLQLMAVAAQSGLKVFDVFKLPQLPKINFVPALATHFFNGNKCTCSSSFLSLSLSLSLHPHP